MALQNEVRFRNTMFLSSCHLIRNWAPILWTQSDRLSENRHEHYATWDLSNFPIPDLPATTTRTVLPLAVGCATEQQHVLFSTTVSRPTNWNPSVSYSVITGHYFTGDKGLGYVANHLSASTMVNNEWNPISTRHRYLWHGTLVAISTRPWQSPS